MGVFTGGQKTMATGVYVRLKKYLKEKDGKVYVLMINSFSKWLNKNFECEDKYATQIAYGKGFEK